MHVTVIVCTFNRCSDLATLLESLAASILPDSIQWEVLVVDNNSTDKTREVVETISSQFPGRFRYTFEVRQGKSFALNTGVREADGDVLAFVDDDVTVVPAWLQYLTATLQNEEWAGTGGRTLAASAYDPPRWMAPELAGILHAHFDFGDFARDLDVPPYGANMAFRKAMFEKYGGFRTDMGPSPNRDIPRPNEDTEFGRRLMAAGERIRYEPLAVVRHPVPMDRLRKEYFLSWWYDFGRASIREVGTRRKVCGIPRGYLSIVRYAGVLIPLGTAKWLLTFDPRRRFWHKCWLWKMAGDFTELRRAISGVDLAKNNADEKRNSECGN